MAEIYVIMLCLGLISFLTIAVYFAIKVYRKIHHEDLPQCEPDLGLVDKPDLIAKIPENEREPMQNRFAK